MTRKKRHPGYIVGNHWLETAYDRICAGEPESEVLADYGWRKCAIGQGTTQFCAMTEEAVKAEREECAQIVEREAMTYADPVWAVEIVNDIRARGDR